LNPSQNSAGRESVFIWNSDLNANATSPSGNYWSNSSDPAGSGTTTLSSHSERLKHHQLVDRKPQLLSEDSFEGGIDSGMMIELEKNLVDIVEVWSNPDDSGIKLDWASWWIQVESGNIMQSFYRCPFKGHFRGLYTAHSFKF